MGFRQGVNLSAVVQGVALLGDAFTAPSVIVCSHAFIFASEALPAEAWPEHSLPFQHCPLITAHCQHILLRPEQAAQMPPLHKSCNITAGAIDVADKPFECW